MTDVARDAAEEIERLGRIQLSNGYRNGLRPAQWQALRFFANATDADRSLSAFARYRRSTLGTASTTVTQLVERGLLGRGDPEARRNVGIYVTEQGHAALADDPLQDLIRVLRARDTETLTLLRHTLEELRRDLEGDNGGDADSRPESQD
jgi:DNA-binding MarR family transcriptional regulator